MLDFTSVRDKSITLRQLADGLAIEDLRRLTHEIVDAQLALIAECADADVTFVPSDPEAYDNAAATEAEVNMPWTLGHVIVHITASAEEAAFVAAELARGVPYHGRSRYEVYWQTVTTLAQCRQRLEESRRMRLATLDLWPDPPHLDNTYQLELMPEPRNALTRFVSGLGHDDAHLGQMAEIVRQAKAARNS